MCYLRLFSFVRRKCFEKKLEIPPSFRISKCAAANKGSKLIFEVNCSPLMLVKGNKTQAIAEIPNLKVSRKRFI